MLFLLPTVFASPCRYFGSHSTTEILQEIRPKLCPHDEAIFGAAACLYLLLPTDPEYVWRRTA